MKPPAAEPAPIAPETQRQIDRSVPAFPGMPWRRRLLFVGLAVVMGWAVVTRDNFQTQLKQAKQLACTPAARQLAGYAEKTCAAFGD